MFGEFSRSLGVRVSSSSSSIHLASSKTCLRCVSVIAKANFSSLTLGRGELCRVFPSARSHCSGSTWWTRVGKLLACGKCTPSLGRLYYLRSCRGRRALASDRTARWPPCGTWPKRCPLTILGLVGKDRNYFE